MEPARLYPTDDHLAVHVFIHSLPTKISCCNRKSLNEGIPLSPPPLQGEVGGGGPTNYLKMVVLNGGTVLYPLNGDTSYKRCFPPPQFPHPGVVSLHIPNPGVVFLHIPHPGVLSLHIPNPMG